MLICFDFDGVIVDSIDHHLHLAEVAHEQLGAGRKPTRRDFQEVDSLTYEGFARWLEIPRPLWKKWRSTHMALVEAEGQASEVFPEIPAILEILARDHTISIITANIEEIVRGTLKLTGVNETVSLVLDSYHTGTKADRIGEAIRHFDADPDQTYMVGDCRSDISAGHAAGVRTVAVGWGFQGKAVLELEKPEYFLKEPKDLLSLFIPDN